jgi:pyruvate,water dikinase
VYAVPFRSLTLADVAIAGGKCAHLADLTSAGFPVPPGFAVTTHAFERVVGDERAREAVASLAVPAEIASAIAAAYAELGAPPVAVRSSAVAEDAADASFAGMQSTYLWVRGAGELLDAVRRCWASYFNPEALAYRAEHGGASGMSVGVQQMIEPRVAGVMFTLNPVTGDRSSIASDASYGLGVTVVGGEVTPDSYLVSKVTRELVRTQVGTKEIECVLGADGAMVTREVEPERRSQPCLAPEEVAALARLAREVERHYGRPQDLEWAIDREGGIFLLQARPETVWTQRPKPAVAADALAAIAATFTGGRPRR